MICPHCGHDNLPGSEECTHCVMDLTQLDRPIANNRIEKSLMEDPVILLHPIEPVTVHSSTPIRDIIKTMIDKNIGALLVIDNAGKLKGVFSERDLLTKVAGQRQATSDMPVERFMTANPETIAATDTLAFALHKMDVGGYRHLPIVQDGKPVGVVSVRDMLRHITRISREMDARIHGS